MPTNAENDTGSQVVAGLNPVSPTQLQAIFERLDSRNRRRTQTWYPNQLLPSTSSKLQAKRAGQAVDSRRGSGAITAPRHHLGGQRHAEGPEA
jgi:hypothetical protein